MRNKKHKLLKFGSIGLLASVFGLTIIGYTSENNNYQVVKADNATIEYTEENYTELYNKLVDYFEETEAEAPIMLNGNVSTYNFDSYYYNISRGISLIYNEDETILMQPNNSELSFADQTTADTYTITINEEGTNAQLYANLNQNEPTPPSSGQVGNSIINAIKSGLGLIGDLASQFLLGFSTLFWNATTSTLTTFGMFSLVMLGVAITFAVIKLVLNILRSNTGA